MSLLLDALKRAEQEKQSAQQDPAPVKPTLELAPIASPGAAGPARPAAAAAPAPPASLPKTAKRSSRVFWIAGSAIALLIAIGVGYVWYSISSLGPQVTARAPAPRPIVTAPAPAEAPAVPAAMLPDTPAPISEAPKARLPAEPRPAPALAAGEAPSAPVSAVLQPARTAERPRIAPEVASGYDALRRGDLATARRDYAAALAADASSLDAALGLATAEARSGRTDAAFALYRRALDIDPRNATALAGIAALSDFSRADQVEQRLVRAIAQHPDSASLHFMLGNVYAAQSLWTQAQSAYFEALRLDPGNPDILHNLAVSIDRMGQPRLAATMYQRALEAGRTQATQFDASAVTKRLAEIDASR